MPFYLRLISSINTIFKNISVALQVTYKKRQILNKRAYLNASLSVEAAMVFSLFLFSMLSLTSLFSMLSVHRQVQAVTEQIVTKAGAYAYATKYLPDSGEHDYKEFGKSLSEASIIAVAITNVYKIKNKNNISSIKYDCNFMEDGENISLKITYKYITPFSIIPKYKIKQVCFSRKRAYIGKESRKRDKAGKDKNDEIVYVSIKSPSRYHLRRNCHYIYNHISSVKIEDIKKLRNKNGGKYKPCKRCMAHRAANVVYIFPSGNKYHADANCSAIYIDVKAVKKSSVEHLGVCSYCGGK